MRPINPLSCLLAIDAANGQTSPCKNSDEFRLSHLGANLKLRERRGRPEVRRHDPGTLQSTEMAFSEAGCMLRLTLPLSDLGEVRFPFLMVTRVGQRVGRT
jgi:hypothetical protein